ncbi:MAG: SDR family NAD(P)-dependent oxidoreductase [Halanaeroarchaeum sp.]
MDQRPEEMAGVADVDLADATVVVTGATAGVGRETALALGRLGATVIAHGRTTEKVDRLEGELAATDAADVAVFRADFADLSAVAGLADAIAADHDRIDVLVNNAGAFFAEGALTDEGVERTVAVNHLAPFVLTNRLRGPIEAADGRVVTTASDVHRRCEFSMADLETVEGYDGLDAYRRSKFANVLFTAELARRLDDASATCFHPGFIPGSDLYRNGSLRVRLFMGLLDALPRALTRWLVSSPADGAATAVYLAVSDAVAGERGGYYDDMERVDPAPATRNESLQRELWSWSAEVTGTPAEK